MEKELAQSDITVRRKVPKTTWNGQKMAKNWFYCCGLPKWLVPRNSWVALALRHPTQPIWTNFEIWANPNFGPRTPKKGQKPVWLLWSAKMVGSACSWVVPALRHPTQPILINFLILASPNFGPGVAKNGPKFAQNGKWFGVKIQIFCGPIEWPIKTSAKKALS